MNDILLHVDRRELATIRAALKFYADENLQGTDEIADASARTIASDDGRLESLGFEEVDALCQRLNLGIAVGPVLQRIHDVLYLDVRNGQRFYNADKPWDADTVAAIAEIIAQYIPRPRARES